MRKTILAFALLLLGFNVWAGPNGFVGKTSRYSVPETMDRLVAAPTVAIDLPFKALAWEDENGKVWLGYNAPAYLKERHGIQGKDEVLKALSGAIDSMTDKALE